MGKGLGGVGKKEPEAGEAWSACDAGMQTPGKLRPQPQAQAVSCCASRPLRQLRPRRSCPVWCLEGTGGREVTALQFSRERGPAMSPWPFPDGVRGEDWAWE